MLGLGNSLIQLKPKSTSITYTENYSVSLDGTDDIITIANSKGVKTTSGEPGVWNTPFKPTAAITISCWVKPNAWDMTIGTAQHSFISNLLTGGWDISLINTGTQNTTMKFTIGVTDDGDGGTDTRGYIEATINEATVEAFSGWKHIVATYDGTTAKLYHNAGTGGVTNDTSASGTTINYTTNSGDPVLKPASATGHKDTQVNPITIGGNTHHGYNYHGLIDNVAIWNVALDAANITKVYNSGDPFDLRSDDGDYTQSANLIGFWQFEENLGVTSADLAGNAGLATLHHDATWSTTVI